MTVRRLSGEQSRFITFCVGRQDLTPAIANKRNSGHHPRRSSTASGNDASLDTKVLLQKFVNYEQQGVPDSAGTSGNKTFDLVCPLCMPA